MANSRYYWYKIKEDFFDGDMVSWLKEQPEGREALLIYLELCSRTLKNDGRLARQIRNKTVPHTVKSLATMLRIEENSLAASIKLLKEAGLISIESNVMFLPELPTMIGSETKEAAKMRALRASRSMAEHCGNKNITENNISITNHNNVMECRENVTTDIDREKELENRERERERSNSSSCGYVENTGKECICLLG